MNGTMLTLALILVVMVAVVGFIKSWWKRLNGAFPCNTPSAS